MKVEKGTRPEDKKPTEAPKETPEPAKVEEEIKKADVAKEEITESAETPVKAEDKPKETAVKDDQKSAPKKKTKTTKEQSKKAVLINAMGQLPYGGKTKQTMQATIKRTHHKTKQTLGVFTLEDKGRVIFECKTLELPWLDNEVRKSCIPTGCYEVVPRNSPKYGNHFHIKDVPGRSSILIHIGNYYTDILGCVLVGASLKDLNRDGLRDVTASRTTLEKLLKLAPKGFNLQVL